MNQTDSEEAIKTLIESRAQAVRDKDVERLMAQVDPSAISFDVVGPLRFAGADAARRRAQEWFASFAGPIEIEIRDLHIEVAANIGYCHSLTRIGGTLAVGMKVDMWVRSTVCLVKRDEQWAIVHQHTSVPFEVKTGRAALDLKP